MNTTTVAAFENTLQKTNLWLKDLLFELEWHETDYHRAYHAMRAVLHALRDRLSLEEAADLAAQLPMLIRGTYYEGWRPANVPARGRSAGDFLTRVADEYQDDMSANAEEVTRAVFRLLSMHISAGEIQDVQRCLPSEIRELWNERP